MADIQLWVKSPQDANFTQLDLFETEPVKLTLSVANIEDPLAANSIFSRTFRVPNSSINGPFFKAVFNVNSVSFDASQKAEAYINDTGHFFTIGSIRLVSIYVNPKDGNIEYEILFYGETSDFGSKISGFLSDLNLSQYDHSLTFTNVTNSWTNNLFQGDVLYPLIEWGYTYTGGIPDQSTYADYDNVVSTKGFTDDLNPIALQQIKPVMRTRTLWNAIFAETGYTYSSAFLEGTDFGNMYTIAENDARAEIDTSLAFTAQLADADPDAFLPSTTSQMFFSTEVSDVSNSYGAQTSVYTAAAAGNYTFDIDSRVNFQGSPATQRSFVFKVVDATTLSVLATSTVVTIAGLALFQAIRSLPCVLTVGQSVKFEIEVFAGGNTPVNFVTATYFTSVTPTLVTMTSVMPANIRKIDFIRSIINRFRLVFEPSKDDEKHFTITPFKDWILGGEQYDWTSKLDGQKDMKISPLFYGQQRLQVYKDPEDADFVNYNYQLAYKQTYGQRNQDSNNELIKGESVTQDSFAPTPLFPIANTVPGDAGYNFLIPHLAKDTNTERQPIQPKLRLVYYNGLQPAPVDWYIEGTATAQTIYPLVSQYSQYPPIATTFDLAWENEAPLYDTDSTTLPTARTSFDSFNVYWKTWYDTVFDPFSRMVEANFVLSFDDVYNLKFNDYIFVKDAWYFVNRVTDYITGQDTNCRVQLVKVGNNIGLTIPPIGETYRAESLCYSSSSACNAFCCTESSGVYYLDGATFDASSFIYTDPFGSIVASAGFYSNVTTTAEVGLGGAITSFVNTAGCDCTPVAVFSHEVCVSDESVCESCCCNGATVTVYSTNAVFESSTTLFTDAALTTPVGFGYYRKTTTGTVALETNVNGVVLAAYLCEDCVCDLPVLFELQLRFFEGDACDACCNVGEEATVYADTNSFATASFLYANNTGTVPATEGYYKDPLTQDVKAVDATGEITASVNCGLCSCLNYYAGASCTEQGLEASFSYALTLNLGDVVTSLTYPDQCWQIVGVDVTGVPVDQVFNNCQECTSPAPGPIEIGDSYEGGIVAYILQPGDIGYNANVQHGLIAAASDQSEGIAWCVNDGPQVVGAQGTAIGTGNQNTIDIMDPMGGCTALFMTAARLCGTLVLNGFSDWYLPSRDELNTLYLSRNVIGGFATVGDQNSRYWSSSENGDFVRVQQFNNGVEVSPSKGILYRVRAIRSF